MISDRTCNKCGGLGPFARKKYGWCKVCDATQQREKKRERRQLLSTMKIEAGCADCGYKDNPVALQFDHISDDKKFTISDSLNKPWDKILEEVAKCEVVCANCHHIRTHRRLQDA